MTIHLWSWELGHWRFFLLKLNSNSLKQRKSQLWRSYGCVVLSSMGIDDFSCSYLRYCFICNYPNTSNVFKICRCTSYFQLSSWYLDVLMKHCLSYANKSILHRAHARPDLPNTYWDIMVKISFYDKCRNSHSHWLIFIDNKRTNTWIYWSNGLTSQNGQFDNLSLQKTNWCQFFMHLSCDWQWISS